MPFYHYTALNGMGRVIRGDINATNERDLEQRLKELELDLVDSRLKTDKEMTFRRGVSLKDLVFLCVHLEQLERAGVPLLDSLADLRDSTDSIAVKNLMADIFDSVRNGNLLSAAMAGHPKIFSEVFIGLVKAGEQTGQLAEIFSHLANHLRWVHEVRAKVRHATYYPAFLTILMSGIVALMMTFVIPKLTTFLKAEDFDLPWYTNALIFTSDNFVKYWYVIVFGPIILYIALKILLRTSEEAAFFMDKTILALPVIGTVVRKIELARFCHFFSITFQSGLGILDCMQVAHNVVHNRVIRESIVAAKRAVAEGGTLAGSLRMTGQFPSLVIRMFKVGEDSGNMEATLRNITFFYDREVNEDVGNMVGIIQPVLTIILGGIMLWISMAVFGPLYASFGKLQF